MRSKIDLDIRQVSPTLFVIDIFGDVSSFAESALMGAYTDATSKGAKCILLNFSGMEFMNSSGIGLLVTLLVRVQRQKQKLAAYGLSDHYKQIFDLTRLNEAIQIFDDENQAVQNL